MSVSHTTASASKVREASRARVPIGAEIRGRLILRYKRFLADIETDDGEKLTVHCPNPGSMLGCAIPGSAVRCSTSDNPKRKLRHTLEMIRIGRVWVGLNTLRANQLVARALQREALPAFAGYRSVRPEVAVGAGSRLDFRLDDHASDEAPAFIEVKSVTLAEGRRARFPDSVTTRGRRHMDTLARLRREGSRAALLFVVQRADCDSVRPADEIDPDYGRALREAVSAGVEVHAVQTRVTARSLVLEGPLPVLL
jgi:sugar fermentation stimulation protein A